MCLTFRTRCHIISYPGTTLDFDGSDNHYQAVGSPPWQSARRSSCSSEAPIQPSEQIAGLFKRQPSQRHSTGLAGCWLHYRTTRPLAVLTPVMTSIAIQVSMSWGEWLLQNTLSLSPHTHTLHCLSAFCAGVCRWRSKQLHDIPSVNIHKTLFNLGVYKIYPWKDNS